MSEVDGGKKAETEETVEADTLEKKTLGKRERPTDLDMSVDDDLPFKRPKHDDLPEELQNRPIRVYVDGIFDLFHFGHARALKQAKHIFPPERTVLLVGCCGDKLTHSLKGKTVMNEGERYESLRHCKWVDEVIEDAPWFITQEFIDEHKIDFVAHGNDAIVDAAGNDVYKFVKDQGKFVNFRRTDGISTTDLIMRIVRDYDSYVRRNLKRGYKPVDMNVPFFRAKQIEMGEKLDEFKAKFKKVKENFVRDFMKRFGAILHEIDMSGNSSSDEYGSDFESLDSFDYDKLALEDDENHHPRLSETIDSTDTSSSSSSSANLFDNHHH